VVEFCYEEPATKRVIKCDLVVNNSAAVSVADIICDYRMLDERVRPLIVLLRLYAKVGICFIMNSTVNE
jgi:DNA polymerase sigma